MLLAVPFGLIIGVVVGSVGGGGAILALPVLVYILDEGVGPATTASLIVVALAAAMGAGARLHDRQVCWRIAFTFAAPAAAGSLLGTVGNHAADARVLILSFVPVMLIAAAATWQRASSDQGDEAANCPPTLLGRTLLAGLGVGILTGFFGVGGGFLIVPVLTIWLGVGFRRAVGTSLVVISLTGIAALGSHLVAGADLDVPITATLSAATIAGALAGTAVGRRLPQRALGQGFALVVLAVAVFLLVDTLVLGGPPAAS
jgi:uncharacterized membrane protein YfcA